MIRQLGFAILLILVPMSAIAADSSAPAWAWQAPISAAPGAPLQRLQLPAAALIRLREPGYADLRVLDAEGRPQAIALLETTRRDAVSRKTRLSPLPILGAPGSLTITGITLRVDREGASRVVRIDGSVGAPGNAVLLGVLLDTGTTRERALALTLDVEMPPQQPVTFQLDTSADLGDWRHVAQSVIYRMPGSRARAVFSLGANGANERYLRVTWRAATPLLSPVRVNGATLTTSMAAAPSPTVATLTGATLLDPHDLRATLSFATPVTAIRIVPADEGLVPVRVLGRDDDERPWQPIAKGSAYRLTETNGVRIGAALPLSASFRQIKIETDARTPGFATAPQLELGFAPREIVVLLTGRAPYVLAAGQAGAASAFLPASALLESAPDVDPALLPAAAVRAGRAVVASSSISNHTSRRTGILWAVLVAGTLSLAGLAWVAARKPAPR